MRVLGRQAQGTVGLVPFATVEQGAAAIRKAMSGFGGGRKVDIPEGATSRPRTRHQIINHVIDVNGNTAKTIAYWFALTNNTPQHDVQLLYFGHYEDELVKVNGKWLFKSMIAELYYTVPAGVGWMSDEKHYLRPKT